MIELKLTSQEWDAAVGLITAGTKTAGATPQDIIISAGLLIKLQEARKPASAQPPAHVNGAAEAAAH